MAISTVTIRMTEMLEFADKDFKAAVVEVP